MYCRYCGQQIPDNSAFCYQCGGKLEVSQDVNNVDVTQPSTTDGGEKISSEMQKFQALSDKYKQAQQTDKNYYKKDTTTYEKKWYQKKFNEMDKEDKIKVATLWGVCIVLVTLCLVWAFGGFKFNKKYTYEQYNQIEIGMTYSQVKSILGDDGSQTSYVGDSEYNLAIYTWSNENPLQVIVVSFENGKVSGKSQTGLT